MIETGGTMTPTPRALRALAIPLLLLVAAPLVADDDTEAKNQIVVLGGVSILDASREESFSWPLPLPGGFPRGPGLPGRGPVDLRTQTSLGNSALLGFRYSRYIKGRLAVEADLEVAPSHDLETGGDVCISDRCFGAGGWPEITGVRPPDLDLRWGARRRVTAWHYGGGLAYDVTDGEVRPVVVFGAGGVSWSESGRTETDFELRFGAGLKILFGNVGARVDVIDHLVLDHFLSGTSEHDIHVTAGLVVGF
jgi:hypothetical protein